MAETRLLNEAHLKEWLGYSQQAALKRALDQMGVPYQEVGGHVVTTYDRVDEAMKGASGSGGGGPNLDWMQR